MGYSFSNSPRKNFYLYILILAQFSGSSRKRTKGWAGIAYLDCRLTQTLRRYRGKATELQVFLCNRQSGVLLASVISGQQNKHLL